MMGEMIWRYRSNLMNHSHHSHIWDEPLQTSSSIPAILVFTSHLVLGFMDHLSPTETFAHNLMQQGRAFCWFAEGRALSQAGARGRAGEPWMVGHGW